MPEYRLHHHPESSHQQIAGLLRRLNRGPVLDVGAASGFIGSLLAGSGITIDAVEPSAERARAARPYYRQVFDSDVESANLRPHEYRVIVCADVLEHTVDPDRVLRLLRAAAADDAVFIVSLPNVAHLAVRLMLLSGRFPRMDRGILDRTHLHFYTRATAEAMLQGAGLQPTEVLSTIVPLQEVRAARAAGPLLGVMMGAQRVAVRVAPRLFTFQWIFVARMTAEPASTEHVRPH
jgi:2-polyprenyl-3-methyl-5-hydroxy-6-metoxy-1,4-benzoquinol methylase